LDGRQSGRSRPERGPACPARDGDRYVGLPLHEDADGIDREAVYRRQHISRVRSVRETGELLLTRGSRPGADDRRTDPLLSVAGRPTASRSREPTSNLVPQKTTARRRYRVNPTFRQARLKRGVHWGHGIFENLNFLIHFYPLVNCNIPII
jgi:hypothetical protein